MATRPASVNALADFLATGYWQSTGQSPHSFQSRTVTVDLTGLNNAGKALARAALDAWEAVADIRFQERRSGADITFSDRGGDADTQVRMSGRSIQSADVNIGTGWLKTYGSSIGTYSFQTYLHEIGHALGLGHSGNYNGGASFRQARFASDSWQTTVMSYFDQDENPTVAANKAYVVTPMMADILAIQKLYGKPQNGKTDGATVWGRDVALGRNALTIYDEGGKDLLDLSGDNRAQDVDLAGGSFSSVFGLVGNIAIFGRTVIENLVAGSGDDRVAGNQVANDLALGRGDDVAFGKDGGDRLNGEEGHDSLDGGEGNDILIGGGGQDSFVFRSGRDDVLDFEDNRDTLVLDDALWGGQALTPEQVLGFAHVEGSDIVFDFGDGAALRIANMTNVAALADDIAII